MRLIVSALAILMATGTPTLAQVPAADAGAVQLVGLFMQGCLVFTGDAAGMRAWIAARHLPSVPLSDATLFLAGHPGEAFGASNIVGKYALVSWDNGSCQAIAMTGDADAVERTMLAKLQQSGVTVTPLGQKSAPERGAMQRLFKMALGERRWTVSLTTHAHADAPNLAPELHLLATAG